MLVASPLVFPQKIPDLFSFSVVVHSVYPITLFPVTVLGDLPYQEADQLFNQRMKSLIPCRIILLNCV